MGRHKPQNRQRHQHPVMEEVEPRILYSADFIPATLSDPLLEAGLPAEVRILDTSAETQTSSTPQPSEDLSNDDILIKPFSAMCPTIGI